MRYIFTATCAAIGAFLLLFAATKAYELWFGYTPAVLP